jgi:hypothetical protein
MATVTEDAAAMTLTCEGHFYMEMTRTFHVSGLTSRTVAMMMEAVEAVKDAGYEPWQPYDGTHGLHVANYSPRVHSISQCTALVTVRYVNGILPLWRGGGALRTVQTDLDIYGNQVTVSFNDIEQTGVMTIMVPDPTFEVIRIQPSFYIDPGYCDATNPPINPAAIKRGYTGKVNGTVWESYGVGTCLMESIDYDNAGLGTSAWNMRYTIRINEKGWDPEVVWIDRDTGEPGTDIVSGVGRKTVRSYQYADFSNLHLELPSYAL